MNEADNKAKPFDRNNPNATPPASGPCQLHNSHWEWSAKDGKWYGFCERCLSE